MTQILFEPEFNIGDVVCLRIATDKKMVIDAYQIKQINSAGEVTFFRYSMYDQEGIQFSYSEGDIQLIESVTKHK